jgi:glycosyltransferase involved in cell wall biosynthesis
VKRRVAIIAGQLVVGGAERQLYLWLANLDRTRFDPIVITLKAVPGDYWEEPIRALGIPLYRETHSGNPLLRLWHLIRMLRAHRPELIHGWHLFAGAYAGVVARFIGTAGISSLRTSAENFAKERWSALLSERFADAMLINSRQAAAKLAANGRCTKQRIFVVQNAVESPALSRQDARRRVVDRLRLSDGLVWIGMTARMVRDKGFEPLLELVAALRAEGQPVGAVLIGDGPIRRQLEAEVDRRSIGDVVRFAGEDPSVREWIGALDVYCSMSIGEGQPNVLLEAAAAGLPIVGWRTAAAEEVLGAGGSDRLVAEDDREALIENIRKLIASREDRESAGRRIRDHVISTFGVPRFVAGVTTMYDELLAS